MFICCSIACHIHNNEGQQKRNVTLKIQQHWPWTVSFNTSEILCNQKPEKLKRFYSNNNSNYITTITTTTNIIIIISVLQSSSLFYSMKQRIHLSFNRYRNNFGKCCKNICKIITLKRGTFILALSSCMDSGALRFRPETPGLPYFARMLATVLSEVKCGRWTFSLAFSEFFHEFYTLQKNNSWQILS